MLLWAFVIRINDFVRSQCHSIHAPISFCALAESSLPIFEHVCAQTLSILSISRNINFYSWKSKKNEGFSIKLCKYTRIAASSDSPFWFWLHYKKNENYKNSTCANFFVIFWNIGIIHIRRIFEIYTKKLFIIFYGH